ncbi:MAG TPA: hypothetical protein VJ840_00155 [Gemmatimonadaceae bacterium]|nr:hypothetical protein [Gemmatimonadaceae bacterium]
MQYQVMDGRPRMMPDAVTSDRNTGSTTVANLREMLDIVLRGAVYTVTSGRSLSTGLRESLVRLCSLAHKREVRAEQLLVMLKDAWSELAEPERVLREHSDEVLSRVITLCIDEYYGAKSKL